MKNKIFPLLIVFLFVLSFVSANTPMPPYVISGDASLISGECIGNFDIKLKTINYANLEYEEISVPVNNDCEYNFALGNSPFEMWMSGMKIDLKFCENNPNCLKTVYIGQGICGNGGGCVIDFTLQPTDLVSTPDGNVPASEVIREVQCWDGSIVNNINDCPDEEEPEGISVLWKILIATAIAILGLFGWSKGFTALANYYYKKGQELEKQGHPVLAKKEYERATKMLKTALKKAAEGKYKK